ncbi:MAG: DEAD/DEAH box helicase family protein [Eubacterium sp.]|nr:DEAD/DEAH box helicase family protein [Eubacterium sp.]
MKEQNQIVKISVRNLVEFMFRSGDISSTGSGARDTDAMQLGSKIHRKIQKSMGIGYEAEVPLFVLRKMKSKEYDLEFDLKVEGRADGVFRDGNTVMIDEIKGVYMDVNEMKEPVYVHKAQAMCYAYIVAEQENLSEIEVQMTYCHMESEQIRRFNEVFDRKTLDTWFSDLIQGYEKWAVYEFDWKKKRNESIRQLEFPFAYREGQKGLAAMVYHTIEDKKNLFIQAPTGVGKTITTVFPAVKAMGEGLADRIFYLTAKTITRTVAEECFETLAGQDLSFKPITITAKEKSCIFDKISCNPEDCPYAKGHYDRVNEAVYDLLTRDEPLNRETLFSYAQKHQVCPFEMSLDAALFSDAVICDYNYVFDPNVYLRRFFSAEKSSSGNRNGKTIFLVDEAHNLVERGREMYSAMIVKEDFLAVKRIVKAMERHEKRPEVEYNLRKFEKSLESVNRALLNLKHEVDEFQVLEHLGTMEFSLLRVLANYELVAKEYPTLPERETMLEFYFNVRNFCRVLEILDDKYQIYADYDSERNFRVKLQCMDPSTQLEEVFNRGRSAVLFSATMLPIRYYKEQLGGGKNDPAVYATSSFSKEQRKVMVARDVTSKYTRRGPQEYKKIASYIQSFVAAKQGNYLVFFPSYAFMDEVVTRIRLGPGYRLLVQSTDMSEEKREEFLNAFDVTTKESVVGCCVMGGIFSEGIDLKEDRLIGAVIVGTGLPMVCNERELFKDYYDKKTGKGFDYSYLYPGVNKVFQAGGRVIRTVEDKGAILLLDERFLQQQYIDLFPREWFPYDVVDEEKMKKVLGDFW